MGMMKSKLPDIGKTIVVDGLATNYHRQGKGPPVVLLHGSGPGVSAWSNWHSIMEKLSDCADTIAPDIVGFGFTDRPADETYNIKLWVSHVIGFLDALKIEKAVFVGNSFGGGVSLAAAMRHADRIAGLVLMGTPSGDFEQTEGLRGGWHYEPSVENMRSMLEQFPYDKSLVPKEMIRSRYEISKLHGGQAAFRKLIAKPKSAEEGPTIVRGVPAHALENISIPALILHGREDRVIPLDVAIHTHRHLINSDLHVFGKCGHWVQHEREADFLSLLRTFVGEVS